VRALFAKNKVRFARGEQLYVSVQHSRQILLNPFQSVLRCIALRFTSY